MKDRTLHRKEQHPCEFKIKIKTVISFCGLILKELLKKIVT